MVLIDSSTLKTAIPEKKDNLDMYIPRGCLKCSWLVKHLEEVPSLVCLFVDLEWSDPNWNHRLQEIVSKLQVLRQLLANRRTQLTIGTDYIFIVDIEKNREEWYFLIV